MCYSHDALEFDLPTPTVHIRKKMISDNPVAAAQVFDRVSRAFFAVIAGIHLDNYTRRRATVDRLLVSSGDNYVGAFGKLNAAYGVIEAQSSSSLHTHFHLWGQFDHAVVGRWIHHEGFRKEVTDLIDRVVTARMPAHIVEKENDAERTVIGSEPYPTAETLNDDSAHVRFRLNSHRHTFTCWKQNKYCCRMCLPQPEAPFTYFAEIVGITNSSNEVVPVQKFPESIPGNEVISMPQPTDNERPVDPLETRTIAFGLGRSSGVEQMQVETNKLTSSLLRCNTSMQPLVSPSQAKAAMFYSSKYCSKDPFELSSTLSLFQQAQIALRKYGSSAEDAGTASRNAKILLQKVLNKIGNIEVSAQQAADAMLGNDSFFSSHKFRFIFIWDGLRQIKLRQRLKSDMQVDELFSSDDDGSDHGDREPASIEINREGKIVTLTQFEQYLYRGEQLKEVSLYDYVACIRMIKVKQRKMVDGTDKKSDVCGKGRKPLKRYPFEGDGCPDTSFAQVVTPSPSIPQIVGVAPPCYPGNRPDSSADLETTRKWTIEAETFVRFYSYLFLSWDSKFDQRDLTLPNLRVLA